VCGMKRQLKYENKRMKYKEIQTYINIPKAMSMGEFGGPKYNFVLSLTSHVDDKEGLQEL
jgi:hypothetical protein